MPNAAFSRWRAARPSSIASRGSASGKKRAFGRPSGRAAVVSARGTAGPRSGIEHAVVMPLAVAINPAIADLLERLLAGRVPAPSLVICHGTRDLDWPWLFAADPVVDHAADHGADQRSDPEQPELAQGPAADEQRGPGAAGRVDRGVGHRDADQM